MLFKVNQKPDEISLEGSGYHLVADSVSKLRDAINQNVERDLKEKAQVTVDIFERNQKQEETN